jgi:hypothetical protein
VENFDEEPVVTHGPYYFPGNPGAEVPDPAAPGEGGGQA